MTYGISMWIMSRHVDYELWDNHGTWIMSYGIMGRHVRYELCDSHLQSCLCSHVCVVGCGLWVARMCGLWVCSNVCVVGCGERKRKRATKAVAYKDQACRVVRYGTMTVCTVRTVLVELRRTTVIVTPYFTVITVKYGTVYGTVPSWHCQCKNGLRMASPPQNLPFSLLSVLLPCADATQCVPERP